jgi:hypothetical protein
VEEPQNKQHTEHEDKTERDPENISPPEKLEALRQAE